MPSVTLSKVTTDPDGRVRVRFGKVEREYSSLEHLKAAVRASFTREDAVDFFLFLILSRQPNLANPAALEGRTLTVDPNANPPVTIT